mmetsp:Transcript_70/g.158  ORF Transcript_70/g.158 Transcript_70/m.158 type:complete len:316 (-) Transcript_70:27-974(-)
MAVFQVQGRKITVQARSLAQIFSVAMLLKELLALATPRAASLFPMASQPVAQPGCFQMRRLNACSRSGSIRLAQQQQQGRGEAIILANATQLTLHLYDHCPYCTRVELVLGWKGLSYRRLVYGYADVDGPTALTGKKVLPVLEWTDPSGKDHRMGESQDIIELLDASHGQEHCIISPPGRKREDVRAWQKKLRKVMHKLARPRLLLMPIADFATKADKQYQMDKYVARGFDYDSALAQTNQLLPRVSQLLADFEILILGNGSLNNVGWTWDDLHTLPSLRVLTCVRGLVWPPRVRAYVTDAHSAAGVELYFDHAC